LHLERMAVLYRQRQPEKEGTGLIVGAQIGTREIMERVVSQPGFLDKIQAAHPLLDVTAVQGHRLIMTRHIVRSSHTCPLGFWRLPNLPDRSILNRHTPVQPHYFRIAVRTRDP
jgi:hypothetical protein